MKEVYALLGENPSAVYNWRYNESSAQSRQSFKHGFIIKVGKVFGLEHDETEALANKAGLSVSFLLPSGDGGTDCGAGQASCADKPIIDGSVNEGFAKHFNGLLSAYSGKKAELCVAATVEDRMFRHIKSGRYLRKESVLALLIAMGLSFGDIRCALAKAGYALSHSVPGDIVVIWMFEKGNVESIADGGARLHEINMELHRLGLPLLMTRAKQEKARA